MSREGVRELSGRFYRRCKRQAAFSQQGRRGLFYLPNKVREEKSRMSQEFELIKHLKDEPMALVILGGVVLIKIIEYAIKYAPRFFAWIFPKKRRLPLDVGLNFISNQIAEIEGKIETIHTTLAAHEFLLDKTSEGTLENQLFNDNLSSFLRLKAFRRLLAMGKNGRIWEKGYLLILDNKRTIKTDDKREIEIDVWLDVLDTELGIPIVDKDYYEARLKEIRRRIYDDFSEK